MPPTRVPDQPSQHGRRADVLAFVQANLPAIRAAQHAHAAAHGGRFLQLLSPVAAAPAKGQRAAPDLDRKPSDVGKGWNDLSGIALPQTLPVAVWVEVYDGPAGRGFVVRAEIVDDDGQRRAIAINEGPETWRDSQGWQVVPEAAL